MCIMEMEGLRKSRKKNGYWTPCRTPEPFPSPVHEYHAGASCVETVRGHPRHLRYGTACTYNWLRRSSYAAIVHLARVRVWVPTTLHCSGCRGNSSGPDFHPGRLMSYRPALSSAKHTLLTVVVTAWSDDTSHKSCRLKIHVGLQRSAIESKPLLLRKDRRTARSQYDSENRSVRKHWLQWQATSPKMLGRTLHSFCRSN